MLTEDVDIVDGRLFPLPRAKNRKAVMSLFARMK